MLRQLIDFRLLLIVVIACPFLLLIMGAASTWNVPGDAATIQGGIDLASPGDTVLVGPGVWTGPGNVNLSFGGVDCVLRSTHGQDQTTINCGYATRGLVFNGQSAATVVQGFTIRNGSAPTGGGIYIDEASPVIKDCRFVSCFASSHGGAAELMDTSAPRFEDCVFDSNSTSGDYHTAGAVRVQHDAEFIRCVFRDNQAGGIGGAIRLDDSRNVTFESCTFEGNSGTDGGAVEVQSTGTTDFQSCTFVENYVTSSGGAVNLTGALSTFTECLFDRNAGTFAGAMYVSIADVTLINCTVARTTSDPDWGALTVTNGGSNIDLNNTIVYGSLVGSGVQCRNYGDVTPVCSDLFGNAGGDWDTVCGNGENLLNGNFSADPLFCDQSQGDFRLDPDSPCLDATGCGLVGAFGMGCGSPSGVGDPQSGIPGRMELDPAVPNPFNPSTSISYRVPDGSGEPHVRLTIYDLRGREVRTLVEGHQTADRYTVLWNGTDQAGRSVPSGVYFYRLSIDKEMQTRRMVLIR